MRILVAFVTNMRYGHKFCLKDTFPSGAILVLWCMHQIGGGRQNTKYADYRCDATVEHLVEQRAAGAEGA